MTVCIPGWFKYFGPSQLLGFFRRSKTVLAKVSQGLPKGKSLCPPQPCADEQASGRLDDTLGKHWVFISLTHFSSISLENFHWKKTVCSVCRLLIKSGCSGPISLQQPDSFSGCRWRGIWDNEISLSGKNLLQWDESIFVKHISKHKSGTWCNKCFKWQYLFVFSILFTTSMYSQKYVRTFMLLKIKSNKRYPSKH
jgi:hypothetical protein